jgi:hypothetical protein
VGVRGFYKQLAEKAREETTGQGDSACALETWSGEVNDQWERHLTSFLSALHPVAIPEEEGEHPVSEPTLNVQWEEECGTPSLHNSITPIQLAHTIHPLPWYSM